MSMLKRKRDSPELAWYTSYSIRFLDATQLLCKDKADAKRKPCDKCDRRVDLHGPTRGESRPVKDILNSVEYDM